MPFLGLLPIEAVRSEPHTHTGYLSRLSSRFVEGVWDSFSSLEHADTTVKRLLHEEKIPSRGPRLNITRGTLVFGIPGVTTTGLRIVHRLGPSVVSSRISVRKTQTQGGDDKGSTIRNLFTEMQRYGVKGVNISSLPLLSRMEFLSNIFTLLNDEHYTKLIMHHALFVRSSNQ